MFYVVLTTSLYCNEDDDGSDGLKADSPLQEDDTCCYIRGSIRWLSYPPPPSYHYVTLFQRCNINRCFPPFLLLLFSNISNNINRHILDFVFNILYFKERNWRDFCKIVCVLYLLFIWNSEVPIMISIQLHWLAALLYFILYVHSIS